MTPTTRTLRYLQANGWLADEVERRITRTVKRDLFGIADVIAFGESYCYAGDQAVITPLVLLVQATSKSNVSARVKKIAESELAPKLREMGVRICVYGWDRDSEEPRIVDCS